MKPPHAISPTAAHVFRVILGVVTLFLAWTAYRTFQHFIEDQRLLNAGVWSGETSETITPLWLFVDHAVAAGVAAAGFFVALLGARRPRWQVIALTLVCLGAALAWLGGEVLHHLHAPALGRVGEKPSVWTSYVQAVLTGFLLLSPPVALFAYHRSTIMDRYLVQAICTPLVLCFAGFLSIWLIIDLTDNGRDFMVRGAGLGMLCYYYLVQLPQMVLMVLPITLLLSLLFALGKMSQANEVISMLGAGRSMVRVLIPIFALGLYATLISLVLNFRWAPEAEARKEGLLNKLEDIRNQDDDAGPQSPGHYEQFAAVAWMYANSLDGRFWFVGRVPVDLANAPMRYVAIWDQNEEGDIVASYKADSVRWNHETREWILENAKVWLYDPYGLAEISHHEVLRISDWRETPWHVVSSSYNAEHLGIPELTTYIRTNSALPPRKLAPYRTHWHFAWAEPFRCLFIVLMAAPLGIVHARRGVLGGVALSIGIFFALMFFDSLFLGLGQSGRIVSWMGAWFPNLLLGGIGGGLLYLRNNNRNPPDLAKLLRCIRRPAAARA